MNTKETDPVWVDAGDDSLEALGQRSQELEEREAVAEPNGRSRAVGLRSPTVTLDEPDTQLLAHQVADSVIAGSLGDERQRDMMECSLALYAALEPGDATESVLARLTVATSNASMDSFSRAAQSGCHAVARDLNLKYGIGVGSCGAYQSFGPTSRSLSANRERWSSERSGRRPSHRGQRSPARKAEGAPRAWAAGPRTHFT
jgi:hypothetical protein